MNFKHLPFLFIVLYSLRIEAGVEIFEVPQRLQSEKKFDEAEAWHIKFLEQKNSPEEIWFSKYSLGEICEEKNESDKAIKWYLEAIEIDGKHAEPFYKLARYYRINGFPQLAYLFAHEGAKIPRPEKSIFVDESIYKYLLDEEISICSFYTSEMEEGYAACNRIILCQNVPKINKQGAYKNLTYYVPCLKNVSIKPVEINLPSFSNGTGTYSPLNPSIQKSQEGYEVICRTVNYTKNGFQFTSRDAENKELKTRNFFIVYDKNFQKISQKEIIENDRKKVEHSFAKGLEDCRLFTFENDSWFTCTAPDADQNYIGIALCKLSKPINEIISVDKFILLKNPNCKRCEKNWLPFVLNNQIHVIYNYQPFVVYQIDHETGEHKVVINKEHPFDFSGFRGSASPVKLDDGYLLVVHEVMYSENLQFYFHRFLFLDNDFNIVKISKPFVFQKAGIEYCCGMTLDHSNKQCILTFGSDDNTAFIAQVDLEIIRNLLEPLSKYKER